MIIEVTKQQVLDAIRNEPLERLKPGAWLWVDRGTGTPIDLTKCSRCLVGAFLCTVVEESGVDTAARAATGVETVCPDSPLSDTTNYTGDEAVPQALEDYMREIREHAKFLLRRGRPLMAALSYMFEGAVMFEGACRFSNWDVASEAEKQAAIQAGREAAVRFVENYFPDDMRIEVDGATARQGVVIVEE